MGSYVSRLTYHRRSYAALQERFSSLRQNLCMTKQELWDLFSLYCHGKAQVNGVMTELELARLLGFHTQPRPLERRVFLVMCDRSAGQAGISFRSFLVNVWAMCVQDSTSLAHMAFQLYDVSGRGALGLADVRLMFREAFGPGFLGMQPVAQLYSRLVDATGEGEELSAHIPLRRFLTLVPAAASLLAPIFHLQRAMQGRLLGEAAWARIRARRDAGLSVEGGFRIVNACRAVDEALGRRRQGLASRASAKASAGLTAGLTAGVAHLPGEASAGGRQGVASRGDHSARLPLIPTLPTASGSGALAGGAAAEPDPSPPAEHAEQAPLSSLLSRCSSKIPAPRPRLQRTVVPVTERHWLPAALALARPAVEDSAQRDHPGMNRPASPGRDLTPLEDGIALTLQSLGKQLGSIWRGAAGLGRRVAEHWRRLRGGSGAAALALAPPGSTPRHRVQQPHPCHYGVAYRPSWGGAPRRRRVQPEGE
jgi:hypothetical protein